VARVLDASNKTVELEERKAVIWCQFYVFWTVDCFAMMDCWLLVQEFDYCDNPFDGHI
jgi:hypothetical protein